MPRQARYKDPKFQADFLATIRGGATRIQACESHGVSYDTLQSWIDRDAAFLARIDRAERIAAENVTIVRSPAKRETADPWERAREEAALLAPGPMGLLLWVDGLVSSESKPDPMPPLSPWWRFAFGEFFASGKRWFLGCVGRRGGKSSSISRVGASHVILTERSIPPGDTGIAPLVSTEKREATSRLRNLRAVLDRLGVEYSARESSEGGGTITLQDSQGHACEFRVQPATVSAASGFTGVWALCDEETKWKNKDTNANPAPVVLDALRPVFTSQPEAIGFRVSSAFAAFGTHFEDIEAGPNELHHIATIGDLFLQIARDGFEEVAAWEEDKANRGKPEHRTAHANNARKCREYAHALTGDSPRIPSWVANPTLDAVRTRIEAGPAPHKFGIWLREYGSVSSSGGEETFLDPSCIDSALASDPPDGSGTCFAALDTGSKRNACALSIVERIETPEGVRIVRRFGQQWIPSPGSPLDLRLVVLPEAARTCQRFGCEAWITDAHAGDQVELVAAQYGIATTYTGPDPFGEFYRPFRDGLHRGEVILCGNGKEEVGRQLKQVRSAPRDGGGTKIVIPEEGDMHGDEGVSFVRAAVAAGVGAPEDPDGGEVFSIPSRYASELSRRERR